MKIGSYIVLISSLFVLTACPGGHPPQSALEQLQANKMDFPDLRSRSYSVIDFQLSSLFDQDYSPNYTLQANATAFVLYELDLHFSIERFDRDEAEMFQYAFDTKISPLDAVHDNFLIKRKASLVNVEEGIKKELPTSIPFPGFIQVINGERKNYGLLTTYMTATMEIGNEYYVFQFIGKEESLGYLYDDFIDILSSVHV